eukprot:TRINITY_DN2028_c0_g1::TRINITY_DN2028_c0_g1_i1::g.21734::m.21734 TRINITY_DN2028_c0_g1::TRINITY_DN2028_c0_g1_i1::g.21734  ORF type:complete len:423 (+),score=40.41,sp/Q6NY64/2ABD_DANRE/26.51/1e-25 TRINITY_DN2028_c0_g1_i1:81-1349(+)
MPHSVPDSATSPETPQDTSAPGQFALRLAQVFGGFPVQPVPSREEDLISAVRFSDDGDFLGIADRGHRVVIFARESAPYKMNIHGFFVCKPASKSAIVTSLEWLPRMSPQTLSLLATADKAIHLWRIPATASTTKTPRSSKIRTTWNATHESPILSISKDAEALNFLSADISTIVLHRIDRPEYSSYIIQEDESDSSTPAPWITSTTCHPHAAHIFAYSNNHGTAQLCDMRIASDIRACSFKCGSVNTFASQCALPSSPTTLQFSPDGGSLMIRDVLGEQLVDLRMPNQATGSYNVYHSRYLVPHSLPLMFDAYKKRQMDVFDIRMATGVTAGARFTATGLFSNTLSVHDRSSGRSLYLSPTSSYYSKAKGGRKMYVGKDFESLGANEYTLSMPVCHMDVHPSANAIAMGAAASLCMIKICS